MRKIFQKWLFLFVAAAFVITFSISFVTQTRLAKDSAISLIKLKIEDAKQQLKVNNENLNKIRRENDERILVKARAAAALVNANPKAQKNAEALEKIRTIIDADAVYLIDKNGIITNSTIPEFMGFDMKTSAQSKAFLPILKDKSLEIVQEPMPISFDNKTILQHAGVALKDGFLQIAYVPKRLAEAMEIADIKNFAPSFRIGTEGKILLAEDNKIISTNSPEFVGKSLMEYGINPKSIIGTSGTLSANIRGMDKMCAYDTFQNLTILGCLPKHEIYISRNDMAWQLILLNVLLFLIVFVLISVLVQYVVINGIYKINKSLKKITNGDLNEKVTVTSNKEFSSLSKGINTMVSALKAAITEAAARIDAELKFAKDIQHSAMPNIFPPYPDHKEFDIYANMFTAKEVGGDFYDFFFVDDHNLAIVIADVSGKGIPAALYMMTAKTLIKSFCTSGLSPDKAFIETNHRLCENNEAGMFVTAFMGVININTGDMVYVNAGHNPPVIYRKDKDAFEYLSVPAGLILGGVDDFAYTQNLLKLKQGDILFLYTDGVTEAVNTNHKLYSSARLLTTLNKLDKKALTPETILNTVKKSVDTFAKGEGQADDITMLALCYKGSSHKKRQSKMQKITLQATVANLGKVLDFIVHSLNKCDCDERARNQIKLAVEEVYVNIANYSYQPDETGKVTIGLALLNEPKQALIQFIDEGKPYNPFAKNDPSTTAALSDRNAGGFGVFIVKQTMDDISYSYKNHKNILTIRKKL